jgi:hypothetical protein
MMAHTCNPSTWEAEAERSGIQGQSGLLSKTLLERRKQGRGEKGQGEEERTEE